MPSVRVPCGSALGVRLVGAPCGGASSSSSHPSTVAASHSSTPSTCSPSVGLYCSTMSCTCLPSIGLSRGTMSVPHTPAATASSSAVSCSCPASPPTQGSNTLGFAVAAPSAMLACSTPAVSLVGAGAAFTAGYTPPGSYASTLMCSEASASVTHRL